MNGCTSKLKAELLSEKGAADTFNYLERLFNAEKKPKVSSEQLKKINGALEPHLGQYQELLKKIQSTRMHNGYDKVNLSQVFSFMHMRN
mmetsp:Transcript_21314/g.18921  ORF Transcript_21314/g.18921 Transcript_21314/m.18921 type:complete len:89 (-) Transcript_21314:42-308(-)